MARHISVHRREDLSFLRSPPEDVASPEFDRWSDEASRLCLFDAPLGSGAVVREFWSAPAEALRLPLIASIYDRGFYKGIEWSCGQLDQLEAELFQLERHWDSLDLTPDFREDIRERLTSLRAAVEIARRIDGVLTII
jgi:hypothetical protein